MKRNYKKFTTEPIHIDVDKWIAKIDDSSVLRQDEIIAVRTSIHNQKVTSLPT